ncbi:zinc finger, CCHC-type containing protein [Tanacetum coccineum]
MFRLNIVNNLVNSAFMSSFKLNDSTLWHAIVGHVHIKRMQDMSRDGLIPAFDMDTEKCKICTLTKITKKHFQSVKRETKVLELIHSDLCDLHAIPTLRNKKYFVAFIDDAFRDAIFDENRFSSIPKLRWRSLINGTDDEPKIFDEAIKSEDGFRPKSGIYYFYTYALVARISAIRLLIALSSIYNLIIRQMDVKITFLNGELDQEVYINQPYGFIMPVMKTSGYLLNQAENCVHSKFNESGKRVITCLYVDDMLIFGNDQDQVDLIKEFLSSRFSMKDMGDADVILGIRIKYESNGILISQSYYIEKRLKIFNYFDCTPVSTPMDTSEKLGPNNGQVVS